VLSPAELLHALDQRFELLAGGRRHSARHRTLEATLDWSYDLLGPHEQAVLRSLGVFVDGFDLDAVGAVAGITPMEAVNVVDALAARSLLVRTPTGRFRLLETVKAYAERRLSTSGADAVRDAHLAYFHRLAMTFGRTIGGELRFGRRLRPDRANLTAAFERAASGGQWTMAAELLIGGHLAYETGSALEVRALVDRAVDHVLGVDDDVVPFLWCVLLFICTWLSDWPSFGAVAHAMANSNNPPARAFGWLASASASSSANAVRSAAYLERATAELRAAEEGEPGLNSSMLAGWFHYVRAAVAAYAGDYDLSLAHAQACDAAEAANDYRTVNGLWATQLGAACQLVLDQPERALHTVAPLEQYEVTFSNGDEVRALACLELGRVEEAETLIRDYARRAATGRIAAQASDGALLLAALCWAEGQLDYAVELLLRMGVGSQPATIVYGSWLAAQLGVAQARAERLASALRYSLDSEQGPNGTVTAREAVGQELARRGWIAR
jgi:predicted ATPase